MRRLSCWWRTHLICGLMASLAVHHLIKLKLGRGLCWASFSSLLLPSIAAVMTVHGPQMWSRHLDFKILKI